MTTKRFLKTLPMLLFALAIGGCSSYQFGKGKRILPGGYDRVSIPIFANKTQEVGLETYFTENLRTEFERSRLARVVSSVDAQMILEGTISKIQLIPGVPVRSTDSTIELATPQNLAGITGNPLPSTAVLSKQYTIIVDVHIDARKASDHSVIWSSDFQSQRQYEAPLLGTATVPSSALVPNPVPGINTAAPLYNNSARQDTVARLARDMMQEAHDRLTENF